MEQIKIKTTLKGNKEKEYKWVSFGKKNKNNLFYKEDSVIVKITLLEKIRMIRKKEEYKIEMIFEEGKKKKGKYHLLKEDISIDLDIETKKIQRSEKNIQIEYMLYLNHEKIDDYKFTLEYEVIK